MHVSATVAALDRVVGVRVALGGLVARLASRGCKVRRVREAQRDADRRRAQGPRRVRRLAPGADRRPAPRRRRGRRRPRARRPAGRRRRVANTSIVRYDAYEDTGGHQSASLALLDAARTGIVDHRDPGPRLRPDLHEGARPRHGRRSRSRPRSRRPSSARWAVAAALTVGDAPAAWVLFRQVQQVLVLNASYEPLNVCSLRRAHVLVFKGKAEVVEELDRPLCSATATFPWPHVIRLVHYVRVPRIVQRKISRRALFARDGWRCVYCGTASGRLTLDHVDPALARRRLGLGERRHLVRAVQPAQGQPAAARGADGAAAPAAAAGAGALHPARDAEDPAALGAVPRARTRATAAAGRVAASASLARQLRVLLPLRPRARVEAARRGRRGGGGGAVTQAVTPEPQ